MTDLLAAVKCPSLEAMTTARTTAEALELPVYVVEDLGYTQARARVTL